MAPTERSEPRDPVPPIGSAIRGTVVTTGPGECVLVRTEGDELSLVGPQAAGLRAGQRVLLRGTRDPAASHDCATGTPFRVAWLAVLDGTGG